MRIIHLFKVGCLFLHITWLSDQIYFLLAISMEIVLDMDNGFDHHQDQIFSLLIGDRRY